MHSRRIPQTILVLVVTLLMGLASHAQADVLLYGFDNDSFDGWVPDPTHGAPGFTTTYDAPLPQVTEGNSAAGFTGDAWYNGGSEIDSPTMNSFSGAFASLVGNTVIGIDATQINLDPADYQGYQNYSFNLYIIGVDHLGNAFSYEMQARDGNNQTPTTLDFNYSAAANGDITNGTAESYYFELTTFTAGGLTSNSTNNELAIDNFRVIGASAPVPEPSTYAMLGAGLLALVILVRRRQVLSVA